MKNEAARPAPVVRVVFEEFGGCQRLREFLGRDSLFRRFSQGVSARATPALF
jgi:hypothetical protein